MLMKVYILLRWTQMSSGNPGQLRAARQPGITCSLRTLLWNTLREGLPGNLRYPCFYMVYFKFLKSQICFSGGFLIKNFIKQPVAQGIWSVKHRFCYVSMWRMECGMSVWTLNSWPTASFSEHLANGRSRSLLNFWRTENEHLAIPKLPVPRRVY